MYFIVTELISVYICLLSPLLSLIVQQISSSEKTRGMQSNFRYNPSGKRAIITGGARGIGYEYSEQLLCAGAKVCLSDINENIGKEAAEKLRQEYGVGKDR